MLVVVILVVVMLVVVMLVVVMLVAVMLVVVMLVVGCCCYGVAMALYSRLYYSGVLGIYIATICFFGWGEWWKL